jgi:bacteriocin-like protein
MENFMIASSNVERILTRQLARELTKEELNKISGGDLEDGSTFTANSCTVGNDVDGTCD